MEVILMHYEILEKVLLKLNAHYSTAANAPTSDDFESQCKIEIENVCTERGLTDFSVVKNGANAFPDITFTLSGTKVGVEVKLHTSSDSWKINGNSAEASTSEKDLERIYILFGKFYNGTREFDVKPMDRCICDIKMTHKARYYIDMKYDNDFCQQELNISYDDLRNLQLRERKAIIGRYLGLKEYENMPLEQKRLLIAESFLLFPEIFSSKPNKYSRVSGWLFGHNILCKNVRDWFTSNGKYSFNEYRIPKIYGTLAEVKSEFHKLISEAPSALLHYAWEVDPPVDKDERLNLWLQLVEQKHESPVVRNAELANGQVCSNLSFSNTIRSILNG